ncbi:hypothetical protein QLL95_gp0316 [Cotonvirus japonicus]|uniref:Uncharacterized protein n=1 Tax=Cotonvirus japonicus TaxID=2811091 RepID=A0ABM7NRL6_9VIRU|nr:hypothetical protein QLL95_gp0316 [Cotonvirus japonicus]BCS82805.1 hypothetical protein [Cotonvirus japonicus]
MSNTLSNTMPNCVILPSSTGSVSNCLRIPLPSTSMLILSVIIFWIIYLVIAYLIYYFVSKAYPSSKVNYWLILLILIASGVIMAVVSRF